MRHLVAESTAPLNLIMNKTRVDGPAVTSRLVVTLTDLLGHGQLGEVRDVPRPLDGAEEQPSGELTDVVDAHDRGAAGGRLHLRLAVRSAVAAAGVGLGAEQQGDDLGDRLPVEVVAPDVARARSAAAAAPQAPGQGGRTDARVGGRDAASLDSWGGGR